MEIYVNHPTLSDLAGIMAIEQAVFAEGVADTVDVMQQRIEYAPETFFVARDEAHQILGYIAGSALNQRYITDDLFKKISANSLNPEYLLVLGLAVSPHAQGQGIAQRLLASFEQKAQLYQARAVSLTCLEHLIVFYEKHGYRNEGVAASQHGNQVWYNLVKEISKG